jgi:uncharacterized membrane protein
LESPAHTGPNADSRGGAYFCDALESATTRARRISIGAKIGNVLYWWASAMTDIEGLLSRWHSAGVLDAAAAERIRAYEAAQKRPAGIAWQGVVALIMGGILLASGVVLFVSAHWDRLGPGPRFALVMAMVAVFHVGGGLARESFRGLSTALHAVGTVATGAAIALVGQIFNIQEHWPAAVLLWALAAVAGWALVHDQAQQILALLLIPAWMLCEIEFFTDRLIGQPVYMGRFLLAWAVLYLAFFLGSRRKVTQGVLFAVAAIAAVAGVVMMLQGWQSWGDNLSFIPFGVRLWSWIAIAAVPLLIAAFKGHRGLIPPTAAIAFAIALPWCQHTWVESNSYFVQGREVHYSYTPSGPNLVAIALVAAFAVFLASWGLRNRGRFLAGFGIAGFAASAIWLANSDVMPHGARLVLGQVLVAAAAVFVAWLGIKSTSKALVNIGVIGFAGSVVWFYSSDIMDKVGRSLGLIGLGVLFLAGGWALERLRRRLIAGMASGGATAAEGAR